MDCIKAHPEVMAKRLAKKKQVKLADQAAREIRIRLSRWGCTNRPFFHIVVADSKAPRNGRHYEQVCSFIRGVRHWLKFCTRFKENFVISPISKLKIQLIAWEHYLICLFAVAELHKISECWAPQFYCQLNLMQYIVLSGRGI